MAYEITAPIPGPNRVDILSWRELNLKGISTILKNLPLDFSKQIITIQADEKVLRVTFRPLEDPLKGANMLIDRLAAFLAVFAVVGTIIFLVIRGEPIRDPNFVVFLRILLSVAAATLGATLPGFLNITWKGGGAFIRAGGALALFAIAYLLTPTVVSAPPPP